MDSSLSAVLAERRRVLSPRFSPPPTPIASLLIHGAVMLLWVLLIVRAFGGGGLFAWSAGLVYVLYDTLLLIFVFRQSLFLARKSPVQPIPAAALPAATVIVAAHNEVGVLADTIAALRGQTTPPDCILIADDGSDDGTDRLLRERFGLEPDGGGALRWLQLPRGGKALALNQAIARAETELVMTIDADTQVEPDALEAMRRAFVSDPALVAATGVLRPFCAPGLSGRLMQWFQGYEYIRNFLSRAAWGRVGALMLLSGAFSCYKRDAVLEVGGFDPDCLVEDYELTHRMRDHSGRRGLGWQTAVIGTAQASTEVPGTLGTFLRQRRRWFGGFLQTQLWYRHMVGNRRYGVLGWAMLPVKAIDTMQPFYGLIGAVLIAVFLIHGRFDVLLPVAGVIGAKIVLDIGFHLWSLHAYRSWLGRGRRASIPLALVASVLEPFSFQLLRHLGAALGWVSFLRRSRRW